MKLVKSKYNELIENIGSTLQQARENAVRAINTELVKANWEIGRHIVEYEQQGKERAEYGTELLVSLSTDLKTRFGKGFSRSSLQLMRLFYIKYPNFQTVFGKFEIRQTVSGKSAKRQTASGILLSWSHYAELLTISDDLARSFYEKQTIKENWSFREMKRQIDSALFQRLAFVARQFKITLDNEHNFIDLVFYHRILKCFVLIDKTGGSGGNRTASVTTNS